jgi:TPR repeat protein
MKNILAFLTLLSMLGGPAAAAPFDDGVRALTQGDFAAARAAFGPLAKADDGNAQFMLGVMSENGLGVAKDLAGAAQWYLKAAAAGVASAQYNIAVFYQLGKGVASNPAEALRWHALAADQGHRKAQNNLGAMYYTGAGVARDLVEAWKWLTLAAQGLRGEAGNIVQRNIAAIEGELDRDALVDAKRRVGAWKKRK